MSMSVVSSEVKTDNATSEFWPPLVRYRLIGVAGKKYHGKDTAATYIGSCFTMGAVHYYAFAAPVKEIVNTVLEMVGVPNINSYSKSDKLPIIDVSLRHLYVTLGTKWGREMIHPHLWALILRHSIESKLAVLAQEQKNTDYPMVHTFIITDVRFQEEVDVINQLFGTMIKVVRQTKDGVEYVNPVDPHSETDSSETNVDKLRFNAEHKTVYNKGTIEDFETEISNKVIPWLHNLPPATYFDSGSISPNFNKEGCSNV